MMAYKDLSPEARAKHIAAVRAWQERNPEKRREYDRARQYKPERVLAQRRQAKLYRLRHLDRFREMQVIAQARRRARGRGTVTKAQWREILDVFGHRCAWWLRAPAKLEQDHVIALAKGGRHESANLVPACRSCNAAKRDRGPLSMVNRPTVM